MSQVIDVAGEIFEFCPNFVFEPNVQHLVVRGSRLWKVNCQFIPTSVQVLDLAGAGNLFHWSKGSDRLSQLRKLFLSLPNFFDQIEFVQDQFHYYPEEAETLDVIPNLPNLETIWLTSGVCFNESELVPTWKESVRNHPILKNVASRIQHIRWVKEYADGCCVEIQLHPKCDALTKSEGMQKGL